MSAVVELLNKFPAEHDLHYGPQSPKKRTLPGQGFTAVSGLDRRQSKASFEATKGLCTESSVRIDRPVQTENLFREESRTHPQTTIRYDSVSDQYAATELSLDTTYRKRHMTDDSEDWRRDSPSSIVVQSRKERMTESSNGLHSKDPSGSTSSVRNTHVSIEPDTRERFSGERSPVSTRNQRMAPPQVRPETEAHLAGSLSVHLNDAKTKAPTNGVHVAQKAPVPMQNEEPSVEPYNPGDNGDRDKNGKRKFSNRTKTGCYTCRTRKKKCDEGKPECRNCLRGGFHCTGYGPKFIDGHKGDNAKNRAQMPSQPKVQDGPQQLPAPSPSDGPRYDHWGRMPPPAPNTAEPENRFPPIRSTNPQDLHGRDVWRSYSWQYREPQSSVPYHKAFTPVEHSQSVPPTCIEIPHHAAWRHLVHPSLYPGPIAAVSSCESTSIQLSHRLPYQALSSSEVSGRYKMLVGESYKGHIDAELLEVRRSCRAAVERWNEAHQYTRATSDEEKGRLFRAIVDPCQRPDINHPSHDTSNSLIRPGSLGSRVVIISPFTCDYGYNIHIGDDTYIGANCVMEDAGKVSIGSRVHVGKDVLFCATNDPINRLGSQADLTAGAIIVEDEVIIGPRTTVLPYRVIGKGATIAAGSVVTKNIPPHTFAAGDPCRVVRTLHPSSEHRQQSFESKGQPRKLAVGTADGSIGRGFSEEDGFVDKQISENERNLRAMRAREGIRG